MEINIPNSKIDHLKISSENNITVSILREDLNHNLIMGNKYRKLKYNLIEAKRKGVKTLLSFGGAYSNHIHATAAAGKVYGFKTIGVIRGEELENKELNPTLQDAVNMDMKLHFVSRENYRKKESEDFIQELSSLFRHFYLLPEGGTNDLAVKGCEEILYSKTKEYDYICVAVGTAGTISGIIKSSESSQKILGFPAIKNSEYLKENINKYTSKNNYDFINTYHFGGYGKINSNLINFVGNFLVTYGIRIEPVYTGKMLYGVFDLIEKGYFKSNSKILCIHTGGLQGSRGFSNKTYL